MQKIAIIVPAHNEEKIIKHTLLSVIALVGKTNVYVVDDGSKDKTSEIAKIYTKNVLTLNPNGGKAHALNSAITHFKLTKRYKYIMPIDADTTIANDFFKHIFPIFEKDKKNKIACVIGKISGRNKKWITTYRLWEYEVNQMIHKQAQSLIGGITVCPGPSTVYRARVFDKIKYSPKTLTEDMDFTFKIHRKKLGKIVYQSKSVVSTQDPGTFKAYTKQIKRWYKGFWQCIFKNDIPWGGQMLDVEAGILATDGLLNSLLAVFYLVITPLSFLLSVKLLLVPFALDLLVFMVPTILYVSYKRKMPLLIKFLPYFYAMRFVSSFIFLYAFINVSFSSFKITGGWSTQRYALKKGEAWVS